MVGPRNARKFAAANWAASKVSMILNSSAGDTYNADVAARELMTKIHASVLLVTCGQDGHAEIVADVSGAGDTMFAALIWDLSIRRSSVHQAAKLANHAGTLTVDKKGISTNDVNELLSFVMARSTNSPDRGLIPNKHRTLKQLLREIHAVRQSRPSAKIVLINGGFDILHAGHVDCLQKAKAFGDILLVGLNADSSVRQIKGHRRPIVPEAQRVQTLAELDRVDFVVLFDQESPFDLIQAITPDFLSREVTVNCIKWSDTTL